MWRIGGLPLLSPSPVSPDPDSCQSQEQRVEAPEACAVEVEEHL